MLLGALAFLLLVGGCQASRAGIYPYNWGIFWDSLLRPSPRIVNGIWLTVSIAITSRCPSVSQANCTSGGWDWPGVI